MEAISRTPTGKKEEKVFRVTVTPKTSCPDARKVHSKHEKSKEVAKPDLVHHVANRSEKRQSESHTLPETNIAPENRPSLKEISSSNHPFSGALAVSFREGNAIWIKPLHLVHAALLLPQSRFGPCSVQGALSSTFMIGGGKVTSG